MFYFDMNIVVQVTRQIKHKYFEFKLNNFHLINKLIMNNNDFRIILKIIDILYIDLIMEHISYN